MPTYQYACTSCEHRFDAVQTFSDAALTECPECGGRLRKLYGSVGVVFKGSGFYRNDSRNGNSAKSGSSAKGSGDSKGSGGSGDSAKSDSGNGAKSDSGSSSSGQNSAGSNGSAKSATTKAS